MFISLQTSSIAASSSWKSSGNRFPIVPILKQSAFNTFPGYITSPAITSKKNYLITLFILQQFNKQVQLLISISLVGTDVSVRVLQWLEASALSSAFLGHPKEVCMILHKNPVN